MGNGSEKDEWWRKWENRRTRKERENVKRKNTLKIKTRAKKKKKCERAERNERKVWTASKWKRNKG